MFLGRIDLIHHYEEKHNSILKKGGKLPTRTLMGKEGMKKVKGEERHRRTMRMEKENQ